MSGWYWCPTFGVTHLVHGDSDCSGGHVHLGEDDALVGLVQRLCREMNVAKLDAEKSRQRTFELSALAQGYREQNEPLRDLLGKVMEHCLPDLVNEPPHGLFGVWREVQQALWHKTPTLREDPE